MSVGGEHPVGASPFVRVFTVYYRESRTQEIDNYIAEGKIPVHVDLSQHPEKSVEARACMFLMLPKVSFCKIHFSGRVNGKGCRSY